MKQALVVFDTSDVLQEASAHERAQHALLVRAWTDTLLWHIARHGLTNITILFGAEIAETLAPRDGTQIGTSHVRVKQRRASEPLITSLREATTDTEDAFLLFNGWTIALFNYLSLFDEVPSARNGVVVLNPRALSTLDPTLSTLEELIPSIAYDAARGDAPFLRFNADQSLSALQDALQALSFRGAAFFDRDGTLNVDDGYTFEPDALRWQPGAIEAIRACNDTGRYVVVATNQSGLARGRYDVAAMNRFHAHMQSALREAGAHVDAFYHCPYHEDGRIASLAFADHPDRKPNAGMLRRALQEMPINAQASFMIGDRENDRQAAQRAGIPGEVVAPGALSAAVAKHLSKPSPTPNIVADARSALIERAHVARQWLFDHAFPLWWELGFDRANGCFHERLGMDGAPPPLTRRVRVQARQTYVYAAAGDLGWPGPWREAVRAGLDVLLSRAIRPDGGSRHALGADGAPLDERRDLYDSAFVLFALAHGARALGGDQQALAAAYDLHAWLEAHWAHPAGGFLEGDITPTPPRRQNPHMHLFEAFLALYEATRDPMWRDRAARLAELFTTRLFQAGVNALPEYFDDSWRRLTNENGIIAEPGHHFEWCWLLYRWRAAGGNDVTHIAERLRIHAEVYGVDPASGVTIDEVHLNGMPRSATARLWPQTERIKANVARYETCRDPIAAMNAAQAFDALMDYCDVDLRGLYRDKRTQTGAYVEEPATASSLYHITLALAELLRVVRSENDAT